MKWQEWYFKRAADPTSQRLRDLLFKEVKPGCSIKQLGTISQAVLDKSDPLEVNWTRVRSAHLYLRRGKLSDRALLSALSNMQRLVSKGMMRAVNPWFRTFSGYSKKQHAVKTNEVLDESIFEELVKETCNNQPQDLAAALRALLYLSYYCGISVGRTGLKKLNDLLYVEGAILIYDSGRLVELPAQVAGAVRAHMKLLPKTRRKSTSRLFTTAHRKIASPLKTLHNTHASLKRLRA